MAVQVSFDVEKRITTNSGVKTCDWGRLMKDRLVGEYKDMTIELESDDDKHLEFTMEFTNRPTTETEILDRIYGFLRDYPTMEMQDLKIKLLV